MKTRPELERILLGAVPRLAQRIAQELNTTTESLAGTDKTWSTFLGLTEQDGSLTLDGQRIYDDLVAGGFYEDQSNLDLLQRNVRREDLERYMVKKVVTEVLKAAEDYRDLPRRGQILPITNAELLNLFRISRPNKHGRFPIERIGRIAVLALDNYFRDLDIQDLPFYVEHLPVLEDGQKVLPVELGKLEMEGKKSKVFAAGLRRNGDDSLIYWDITEDPWNWRKPYAINGELQEVPLSQILYYKRFQTIHGIERSLEFAVSFLGR